MAAGVARALLTFYSRHRHRFEDIIADNQKAQIVSLRPHVRFDGDTLEEISSESWPMRRMMRSGISCGCMRRSRALDTSPSTSRPSTSWRCFYAT